MSKDHAACGRSTGSTEGRRDRLEDFHKGYSDSVSRTITADDVAAFARLTGDYNELHTDDEFAARTQFEQRVVHGFLHASFLSTLIGMKISRARRALSFPDNRVQPPCLYWRYS